MRLAVHDEALEPSFCGLPFVLVVEFARIALLATKLRDDKIRGRQWGKRGVGMNPRGIENAARMMLRELY
jgi:hypothetical protein